MILKEYAGYKEKVAFQDALLHMIQEKGFSQVETIIRNKDQELLTQDLDGTMYILKTYTDGRECNVRDMEECRKAVETLASLHRASRIEKPVSGFGMSNLALQVTEEMEQVESQQEELFVCHGDYQHHNIMVSGEKMHIINFEKCLYDSPVRDLYLFMRKLLEKSGWCKETGTGLILAYEKNRPMEKEEYRQLYYRLAYPEKFWKIVNFYYNSGKAWIPDKYMEKLLRVTEQEKSKQVFLESFKIRYGLS